MYSSYDSDIDLEDEESNDSEDYYMQSNYTATSAKDKSDSEDERSQILLDLWNVVSKLEAPGTFACGGPITTILPGKAAFFDLKYINFSLHEN